MRTFTDEARKAISAAQKASWGDPEKRAARIASMAAKRQAKKERKEAEAK